MRVRLFCINFHFLGGLESKRLRNTEHNKNARSEQDELRRSTLTKFERGNRGMQMRKKIQEIKFSIQIKYTSNVFREQPHSHTHTHIMRTSACPSGNNPFDLISL